MIDEKINSSEKNIEYIVKTTKKSVIPRSEKQKNYVRALKESDIIISAGPAGTGKTFLAVAVALTMLLDKKIERITVLAKDFTPAAMEFHKKNMSAKGYRMEGTIVPRRFQIIEGVDDAKDLFEGEEYYAVTFVKE